MINFDLIKNMELRLLVTASESINSLSAQDIEVMVSRIAALPVEGQLEMIDALRDEREQARAAKLARGITPEMEAQQIKNSTALLAAETRGFDMEVNKAREAAARNEEGAPENILNTL